MTRRQMRPVRQQGRSFYLAVLAITLLACYSWLRDRNQDHAPHLVLRSLEARDQEVRAQKNPKENLSY
jgi:hypothetical protein